MNGRRGRGAVRNRNRVVWFLVEKEEEEEEGGERLVSKCDFIKLK